MKPTKRGAVWWQGVDISSLSPAQRRFFRKFVGSLKIPNYDSRALIIAGQILESASPRPGGKKG